MKRLHASVVLAICGLAAFALLTAPAIAKKPAKSSRPTKNSEPVKNAPVVPGSQYLALGDSVTFGYEEASVVPAPNYHDAASFVNYPQVLGQEYHLGVANASCPGETSSSFINTSGPSNGCENNPAHSSLNYRTLFPLHVSYSGSQLAYALSYLHGHHQVRLVSLMIGANDFFVCEETTSDKCGSSSEQAATSATVTKNVKTILSAIRNTAHYNGQIVVLNYYSLDYASAAVNAQTQVVNTALDAGATPFHVEFADGFGEFQAGALHSGSNSCTAGLLTMLSAGGCGVHPSYSGQSLLAQAVAKVIKVS